MFHLGAPGRNCTFVTRRKRPVDELTIGPEQSRPYERGIFFMSTIQLSNYLVGPLGLAPSCSEDCWVTASASNFTLNVPVERMTGLEPAAS
jgi:hypothetical protein